MGLKRRLRSAEGMALPPPKLRNAVGAGGNAGTIGGGGAMVVANFSSHIGNLYDLDVFRILDPTLSSRCVMQQVVVIRLG